MRANQAFPKKYLASAYVKDRPRIAVISHLSQEEVGKGNDAEQKYVLYFEGDTKPVVLNKTRWATVEDAFGDSDNWPGHKLKIKCGRTSFGNEMKDCIRFEAIAPKPAPKPEIDPDLDDEIAA